MRAGRSWSWAAWVASALLHALIAALVLRAERTTVRVPAELAQETVEFELGVEVGPEEVGPRPAAPARPSRASSPAPSSRPAPPPSGPSPFPSSREAGRGDVEVEAGRGDVETGRGDVGAIDLSLGALADDVKGKIAGPAVPEATLRARPGRFAVDEMRVEIERQQDAVANVDRGRVDPLLYEYLRGARDRFQEDAARLADAIAVGPGSMVRGWGRGYLRTVEEKNRGVLGARVDAPREGGGDTRNEKSPGADVLSGYDLARRQAQAGAEERRAEVCLDVAAGRETAATLRRSSGDAALDRLTLESFTKAIAARPVPPDARRGLACYELQISAFRMPPLPTFSCGVGPKGVSCAWPFKKITSVKGRLLSFDDVPAGERAARSLLRKPR